MSESGEAIAVLHVDDDTYAFELLRSHFRRLAPEISLIWRPDVDSALEYLDEGQVDCIISDFQMPGRDGLELLQAVRGRGAKVPFIFFTGQGNEQIVIQALRLGADDYFSKDDALGTYQRLLNSINKHVHMHAVKQEHLENQQQLISSESLLRDVFNSIQDGLYVVDSQMRITLANPTMKRWFGEIEKETPQACHLLLFDSEHVCGDCPATRCLQNRQPATEVIRAPASAPVEYLEVTASPMLDDSSNEMNGMIIIVRDVTQQMELQQQAREHQERIKGLSSATFEGVVIHHDGIIVESNKKFAGMVESTVEQVIGKNALDFVDDGWKDVVLKNIAEAKEASYRAVLKTATGGLLPVDIQGRPVTYQGKKMRVAALRPAAIRKQARRTAIELAHQFRKLLKKSKMIGISLNTEGGLTFVNDYFLKITGLSEEEAFDLNWFENFIPEKDRATIRRLFSTAINNPLPEAGYYSNENTILLPSGEERLVAWTYVTDLNLDGKVTGLSCIGIDLTERNELIADRKVHEQRLQTALENANIGLWDWDMESNGIFVNETWADMCGYELDELQPVTLETFEKISHPEDYQNLMMQLEHYLSGVHATFNHEHRLIHKDGSLIPIVTRGRVVERKSDGSPARMIGIHMDISDLKEAQRELAEREELFSAITATAQDAIIMMDHHGAVSYWNHAAEAIFGYTREEIMGKPLHSMLAPHRYRQQFEKAFGHFRETGTGPAIGNTHELIAIRKDGGEIYVELSLSAVSIRDHFHAVGIIRDITARKRSEANLIESRNHQYLMARQLETSNDELKAFTSAVSHDLKAPLRHVAGFASYLRMEHSHSLNEEGQRLLRLIDDSVSHMNDLIDSLLRLSHLQSQELQISTVDLSAIGRNVVRQLRHDNPGRNIRVTIKAGMRCQGDASLLTIALENLLGNAWKYTRDSDPAEIRFEAIPSDGAEQVFTISDNGSGFEQEQADKLFIPFVRLHSDEEFSGTGIGLSTVKRIIDRHGGTIEAESAPGEGASFTFSLPKRQPGTPQTQYREKKEKPDNQTIAQSQIVDKSG